MRTKLLGTSWKANDVIITDTDEPWLTHLRMWVHFWHQPQLCPKSKPWSASLYWWQVLKLTLINTHQLQQLSPLKFKLTNQERWKDQTEEMIWTTYLFWTRPTSLWIAFSEGMRPNVIWIISTQGRSPPERPRWHPSPLNIVWVLLNSPQMGLHDLKSLHLVYAHISTLSTVKGEDSIPPSFLGKRL